MAQTETERIKESIDRVIDYHRENPDEGKVTDSLATATAEEGLRIRIESSSGYSVEADMPEPVGGGGSVETPGWLFRAGLASSDAMLLKMRAAQEGIDLTTLEVTVDSESDERGMLGVDDSVPPGPLSVRTHFRLAAEGVQPEQLKELVEWVDDHSPVADIVGRAVPRDVEIDID